MFHLLPRRRSVLLPMTVFAIACGPSGSASDVPPDPFEAESRGGKMHNVEVQNFDAASFVSGSEPSRADLANLFTATLSDTPATLKALRLDDFSVASASNEVTPAGIRLSHVRLRQHVEGIPVWGTYVSMTAKPADIRSSAKLLASSHHVYAGVKASTKPELTLETAAGLARVANRMTGSPVVAESKLILWPLKGSLDLVWSIKFQDSYYRALVYASGDLKGRVLRLDERHYQVAGTVTGEVAFGGAPGGSGTPNPTPLPRLEVSGDGLVTTTDGAGQFSLDVAEGTIVAAALAGLATINVEDQTGLATTAEVPAEAVTNISIGEPGNTLSVANNTAYFFIDQTLDFLNQNGVEDPALLDLTTNTNIADACNAFYTQSSINFFQAGSVSGFDCNNTAEATIVMHEYGHFVDDVFGGITNGGLSEGWGDLLACMITAAPDVGPDFFIGDDAPLRTCDNDYQFPISGNDQVHALGQAWAGFGWHAREGLIAALGETEGDAIARQLILPSLPSNAADIPAAVREVFIRDDDDGDLSNLTPHWDILLAAAELHSLAFIVDEDLVAPSATTDLAVASSSATSAELTWTASGDDGDDGEASFYDVRRSTQPITDTNFAQATPIAGPVPLPAGEQQTLTVALIPGETVFFALRTFDEQNNGSAVSNVVEVTAGEGTVVFEDSFENGAADWQTTGLWHVTQRKASDGASSFWYGDEATGNYDTGDTTAGDLLSPAIDLTGAENPILVFSTEFDVEAGDTFDRMIITAFDEADPSVTVELNELEGFSDGFQNRAVSLAGMSDRSIRVRFSFDTVDSVANSTEGWFVDNVKVIADNEIIPADLIINEILADPGSFDANNDGEISFRSDEFVEIVNLGSTETSLAGITIEDARRVRFTFPEDASIEPGGVVVVFGGGAPNIGLPSFTAGNLSLNNLGETVTLRAANGSVLSTVGYGSIGGQNQSLNRETDGDRDAAFVLHTTVGGSVASPGTKADGSPFTNAPTTGAELLINEILSDPGSAIDANQDGVFHSTQDEFIEVVNIGDEAIDLSGTFYNDAVGTRFKLPDNTVLEPGGVLVLFGGGAVNQAAFEGVTVVTAGGSLFLNNGGDVISLTTEGGTTLVQANFGGSDGHSLTRSTDLSPFAALVNHASLSGLLASPGRRNDGGAF